MQAQKDRGRAAQKFNMDRDSGLRLDFETDFTGYEHLHDSAEVVEILKGDDTVDQLDAVKPGSSCSIARRFMPRAAARSVTRV